MAIDSFSEFCTFLPGRYPRQAELVQSLAGFPTVWMACGNSHSVVIGAGGEAMAFGLNTHGQVGSSVTLFYAVLFRSPSEMHLPISCGATRRRAVLCVYCVGASGWHSSRGMTTPATIPGDR